MGDSFGSRHLGAGVPTRARSGYGIHPGAGVANGKTCHRVIAHTSGYGCESSQFLLASPQAELFLSVET